MLVIYWLILCVPMQGQEVPVISSIKKGFPDLQFEEKVCDFSVAGPRKKIIHYFQFTNKGEAVLVIEGVSPSCGCLTKVLPSTEFASGAAGVVEATFETSRQKGKQTLSIFVLSNDPNKPEIELKITGTVSLEDAVLEPESLHFGNVERGEAILRTVRLFNLGGKPISLNRVEAAKEYFVTHVSEFEDLYHKGLAIDVVLRPDAPVGHFVVPITLHTNSTKRPRIDILIHGNVVGKISVEPAVLLLRASSGGRFAANKLKVTSKDGKEFDILDIAVDPPALSTKLECIKAKRQFDITVEVGQNTVPGNLAGRIEIYTDHPEEPMVVVPFHGIAEEPCVTSIRQSEIPRSSGKSVSTRQVYITRVPSEADTYVSAWLIKRFLDTNAEFVFVPIEAPIPEGTGILFDVPSAQARWRRSHRGSTAEEVLTEIKDANPAVKRIVVLVRQLEIASWLVSSNSEAGRLHSSILKMTDGINDPQTRVARVFVYLDKVYAAGGKVP